MLHLLFLPFFSLFFARALKNGVGWLLQTTAPATPEVADCEAVGNLGGAIAEPGWPCWW